MRKATIVWPSYFLAASLAFLYNDWVLGYILNPRMSANRSLISELSATTQPYHWVFQALDITAGVITIACTRYVWELTGHITSRGRILLTGLFVFVGLDSIVDASLPINCAPSVDAACHLLSSSIITEAHLIESNVAGTVIAIAPIIWWWLHRSGKHRHIATASIWLVIIETAVGLAALTVRITNHGNYGGIQRIYQGVLGLWVGLLAYTAITIHVESRAKHHRVASGSGDIAAASSAPNGGSH